MVKFLGFYDFEFFMPILIHMNFGQTLRLRRRPSRYNFYGKNFLLVTPMLVANVGVIARCQSAYLPRQFSHVQGVHKVTGLFKLRWQRKNDDNKINCLLVSDTLFWQIEIIDLARGKMF